MSSRLHTSLEQQEVNEGGAPGQQESPPLLLSGDSPSGGRVCVSTRGNCMRAQEKRAKPMVTTTMLVLTSGSLKVSKMSRMSAPNPTLTMRSWDSWSRDMSPLGISQRPRTNTMSIVCSRPATQFSGSSSTMPWVKQTATSGYLNTTQRLSHNERSAGYNHVQFEKR